MWGVYVNRGTGFSLTDPSDSLRVGNPAFSINKLWGCSLPRFTPNGVTNWLAGESFVDGTKSLSYVSAMAVILVRFQHKAYCSRLLDTVVVVMALLVG